MTSVELTVGKPANGGTCVGRVDGRVAFCRLCLPGETVSADVVDGGPDSRFWRLETTGVLSGANPGRVQPACPWFAAGCGGCSWLHAQPSLQLDLKTQVLRETLQRIGGLESQAVVRAIGPDRGWRTRVTLHVDADGRCGLHAARSHQVLQVVGCLQADPRLDLDEVLRRSWPAGATVLVAVSDAGRGLVIRDGRERTVIGPAEHVDTVRGRTFRRAADGFWQAHKDAAEVLAGLVCDLANVRDGEHITDLYAGVGLFGLTASGSATNTHVLLVEGDRTAAGFAVRNAEDDPHVRVRAVDVRRWARETPRHSDVVVLDPPRAGAGAAVVAAIAVATPRVVVYVSCDPATLARDLKTFAAHGYTADHVDALDLFPGTAHIETVVRLHPAEPG